ncbi:MAG: PD-(D/E)XK nuclease family protein [Ectobacillus sp.]
MFEARPFPEFSWSISRHKTFFECKRKYAYQYYVSHNGWRFDSPLSAQEAYFYKKLSNLPMYLGDMLHQAIYQLLSHYRFKELPPIEAVEKYIRDNLNTAYKYSQQRQLWHQKPKAIPLLRELVYGEAVEKSKIADLTERLRQSLEALYENESFQKAMFAQNIYLYEAEQFHSFRLHDIKVYIVMDLLYKDENVGRWFIIDWKTGRESKEDRNQLALYSLYLHEKYHIHHEKIEIRNEYLASKTQHISTISTADLERANEIMLLSVNQMLQYVADVEQNQPVDLKYFEKSEHPLKCANCHFQRICAKAKE